MDTKSFCKICLSIARHQTVRDIDLTDNFIDERAIDSIKSVVRFIKSLHRITLTRNRISEVKAREVKRAMADVLKTKEVILF